MPGTRTLLAAFKSNEKNRPTCGKSLTGCVDDRDSVEDAVADNTLVRGNYRRLRERAPGSPMLPGEKEHLTLREPKPVREGEVRMTVYIIGQMMIHSRDWMDEYFSRIPDVVTRHEGKFKVRGGEPARMEGDNPLPDAAFIIEFPDRDHALSFWNSDEFQSLAVLRRSGSTLDSILVDGLE
ncbi:MAG: DUF1330 domain-containing protein [Paracoccaceae bacterium]